MQLVFLTVFFTRGVEKNFLKTGNIQPISNGEKILNYNCLKFKIF